ncbi:MAG: hypothetical protein A3E83_07360 [Gammaproteobacteria bacterium RIFCSPHIGHO2_12_FULL_41_20]|nr:MAG: hypothetical protein A3E83_07360 [Gammaproteobacteria bacterium RIFCSPHIGHO2_12_FULL_41_20]
MKLLKHAAILPLVLLFGGAAQAKGNIFYTVPFHNVEVKAASKIYVDYDFSAHQQTLVCQTDLTNDALTSVEWNYKNATRKIELPVTLMDDDRFEGHYADPAGTLSITNDFGSSSENGSIFVTCEYRNMK